MRGENSLRSEPTPHHQQSQGNLLGREKRKESDGREDENSQVRAFDETVQECYGETRHVVQLY